MVATRYKCTNFANCGLALSKEEIEIEQLDEFQCPSGVADCQKKCLQPVKQGGGSGIPKAATIAAGVLLVVGVGIYLLWPSSPDPAMAESLIHDYFPRLK